MDTGIISPLRLIPATELQLAAGVVWPVSFI